MTAPTAPAEITAPNTTSTTGESSGTNETPYVNENSASGYRAAPLAPAPVSVATTAPRSRTGGAPWFIVGVTLWTMALAHLLLVPQLLTTKTAGGAVVNLTGVLAEVGIGAALLAVGFARRKHGLGRIERKP